MVPSIGAPYKAGNHMAVFQGMLPSGWTAKLLAVGSTLCQLALFLAEHLPVCCLSRESRQSTSFDELAGPSKGSA